MTYGRPSTILRLLFTAAFLFALTACGDTPDEESPALSWNKTDISPTNNTTPTYSGDVEEGAEVKLQVGEIEISVQPTGPTWSVTLPPDTLKEGPNSISITTTDKRGNTRVIRETVVLDTKSPTLVSPAQNSTLPGLSEVRLVFDEQVTFTPPQDSVAITVTDSASTVISGKTTADSESQTTLVWTPDVPLATNQTYTLRVNAEIADTAGNLWTLFPITFTTPAAP